MPGTDPLPFIVNGVILRRLAASDLAAFQAYRQDPVLGKYQSWSAVSDAEALSFLEQMCTASLFEPGEWFQIGIATSTNPILVGDIGLFLASDARKAEIGFTLRPESQGCGIATTAVAGSIKLLFAHTTAEQVVGIADARNLPSIRLLERVGMRRAESRRTTFKGEDCLEIVYSLRRSEHINGEG
jgi:ribosomal-protein-alanine N-acetyltransferase